MFTTTPGVYKSACQLSPWASTLNYSGERPPLSPKDFKEKLSLPVFWCSEYQGQAEEEGPGAALNASEAEHYGTQSRPQTFLLGTMQCWWQKVSELFTKACRNVWNSNTDSRTESRTQASRGRGEDRGICGGKESVRNFIKSTRSFKQNIIKPVPLSCV